MPKFYYERTVHRYVYEYFEIEADDEDQADERYYNGDCKELGSVIGGRIKYLDDADETITADRLPKKYDCQ